MSLPQSLVPLRRWLGRNPFAWSAVAALASLLATLILSGGTGGGQVLAAALSFCAFTVLVSLGQMLVITTGPGNVDLSIPAAIALSAAVAMLAMDQQDPLILPGLLAAILTGGAIGLGNAALIQFLRIPPIIATLSAAMVVQSIAIVIGRGLKVKPPPLFAEAVTWRPLGIPLLALIALAVSLLLALLLERSIWGRTVSAAGQNARAAWLAGLSVGRARVLAYLVSGALAGLTGALIAGFSGGNSLDQGAEYLLLTIAVTIIGGTQVAGGRAHVPGIWSAALFLYLLKILLDTAQISAGWQLTATGVIIIAVIAIAGTPQTR